MVVVKLSNYLIKLFIKIVWSRHRNQVNRYAILTFNIPGNGYDGNIENLINNYKDFNTRDIAKNFALGLKQLKINHLFAVIGGSVGGAIAWELAALKPHLIEHVIPIAADWK